MQTVTWCCDRLTAYRHTCVMFLAWPYISLYHYRGVRTHYGQLQRWTPVRRSSTDCYLSHRNQKVSTTNMSRTLPPANYFYRAKQAAMLVQYWGSQFCLSVRPSVRHTCALWRNERHFADISMPYEKAITLIFWHQQWLGATSPST